MPGALAQRNQIKRVGEFGSTHRTSHVLLVRPDKHRGACNVLVDSYAMELGTCESDAVAVVAVYDEDKLSAATHRIRRN